MWCEICKISVVLLSFFLSYAYGKPGIYDTTHGLNPGSYSGGGGNSYGGDAYKTLASYAAPGEGLGSYSDNQHGLQSLHAGGGSGNGDYSHGVSVVSLGNDLKGPSFDLTKHGGGGHHGLYGGSFISSGKHGADEEQHGGEDHGHYASLGGYEENDDHSALLAASLSGDHGGWQGISSH